MRKIISPYFIFFYCVLLGGIAIAIPPNVYHLFIDEKYYAFGNVVLLLWVVSSMTFFLLGGIFVNIIPGLKPWRTISYSNTKLFFISLLPILSGLMFLFTFIEGNKDIFWMYFSGMGTEYKESLVTNFYYFSIYILMALSCWLLSLSLKNNRRFLFFLFFLCFAEVVLSGVMMLARFIVIPYIICLAVVYLNHKKANRKLLLGFAFFMLSVLFVSSLLRDPSSHNFMGSFLKQIFGYIFASYNRLSLILSGDLHYSYADTGYYLFPFLSHVPLLHNIIGNPIGVEYKEIWITEFSDVESSGLVRDYIWGTLFGYIYSVLQGFSLAYFFFYGSFVFLAWGSFVKGRMLGIVFYPWFFSSLILSFSSNIAFLPQFFGFIYAYLYILGASILYEFFFGFIKRGNG